MYYYDIQQNNLYNKPSTKAQQK